MQVNSTPSATLGSSPALDATSLSSQALSQDDFLKLLVAQMTSQNPTDPIDNQDLLGQMVQFSTLQQNSSLQKALASLQASQSLVQANTLLGRQVTIQIDPTTTIQGTVSGVTMDSGAPEIVVDGIAFPLSQVTAISAPAAAAPANPSAPRIAVSASDTDSVASISVPSVNP
jgi:flagellar basal-body rod modification protein FlgD